MVPVQEKDRAGLESQEKMRNAVGQLRIQDPLPAETTDAPLL